MGEERTFYEVPVMGLTVRCHQCKAKLEAGDRYYMTDDDSWIFCESCATGRERPHGPKARLYAPHEREPLHKKVTLEERYG